MQIKLNDTSNLSVMIRYCFLILLQIHCIFDYLIFGKYQVLKMMMYFIVYYFSITLSNCLGVFISSFIISIAACFALAKLASANKPF